MDIYLYIYQYFVPQVYYVLNLQVLIIITDLKGHENMKVKQYSPLLSVSSIFFFFILKPTKRKEDGVLVMHGH